MLGSDPVSEGLSFMLTRLVCNVSLLLTSEDHIGFCRDSPQQNPIITDTLGLFDEMIYPQTYLFNVAERGAAGKRKNSPRSAAVVESGSVWVHLFSLWHTDLVGSLTAGPGSVFWRFLLAGSVLVLPGMCWTRPGLHLNNGAALNHDQLSAGELGFFTGC